MTGTANDSDHGRLEEFCRTITEQARHPAILVNPANAKVLCVNDGFGRLLKPNMLDAPRERLSDILRHGTQNEFREMMIDLLKEPDTVREGEIHLSGDLFLSENQLVAMSVHGLDDFEYVLVEFTATGTLESAGDDPARSEEQPGLPARIAELEQRCAEQDLRYQRFIHVLGHELKSPLTAVKGYIELLEYQARDLELPDLKEMLPLIINALNRLHGSIDALYRLGNADLLDRRYKTTDLRKMLPALHEELLPHAEKRGITLAFEEARARLRLNPTLVREILYQLLVAQIIYAKGIPSVLQVLHQTDEGTYRFAVLQSSMGGMSFPEDFTDRLESPLPDGEERKATTFGFETARILVEQAGGAIRFLRGDDALHSFYFTLPKGK